MLENGDCLSIAELTVNGNDLMAHGVPEGRRIGETLAKMLDAVLEEPSLNTRETLLGMIS